MLLTQNIDRPHRPGREQGGDKASRTLQPRPLHGLIGLLRHINLQDDLLRLDVAWADLHTTLPCRMATPTLADVISAKRVGQCLAVTSRPISVAHQ
jgi:hypothetical protein